MVWVSFGIAWEMDLEADEEPPEGRGEAGGKPPSPAAAPAGRPRLRGGEARDAAGAGRTGAAGNVKILLKRRKMFADTGAGRIFAGMKHETQ